MDISTKLKRHLDDEELQEWAHFEQAIELAERELEKAIDSGKRRKKLIELENNVLALKSRLQRLRLRAFKRKERNTDPDNYFNRGSLSA